MCKSPKKLFIISILCWAIFAGAQNNGSTDSSLQKVRIGKIRFEIHAGRSPYLKSAYQAENFIVRQFPYFKFSIGYNHRIDPNSFLVAAIGLAHEESYTLYSSVTEKSFIYTDSLAKIGTIKSYRFNSTGTTRVFGTFDLGIQDYYSPFKNERIKLTFLVGLTFKPSIRHESIIQTSVREDSITNTSIILKNEQHREVSTSKIGSDYPVDFVFNFNPGLCFVFKKCQYQAGLNFSLQWTAVMRDWIPFRGGYIRFYNAFTFG